MDPEFRERRPRFVIDENGKERLSVEGNPANTLVVVQGLAEPHFLVEIEAIAVLD